MARCSIAEPSVRKAMTLESGAFPGAPAPTQFAAIRRRRPWDSSSRSDAGTLSRPSFSASPSPSGRSGAARTAGNNRPNLARINADSANSGTRATSGCAGSGVSRQWGRPSLAAAPGVSKSLFTSARPPPIPARPVGGELRQRALTPAAVRAVRQQAWRIRPARADQLSRPKAPPTASPSQQTGVPRRRSAAAR